jgi:hypothetical protein
MMNESIFILAGPWVLATVMRVSHFELLLPMGVGTLIPILAIPLFSEVFAEFSLVLGLYLIFRMAELAVVSLPALVL